MVSLEVGKKNYPFFSVYSDLSEAGIHLDTLHFFTEIIVVSIDESF